MKALALALMLVNHLIAPLVSPWLAILTGETARFLLIAVFCAPSRFRPTGYWRHARKLSLALLATIAMVATLDYFHGAEASSFVQMPVAWLMLLWLRPVIFEHPFRSAYAGVLVWGAGIAVFLQNPESTGITAWLSGLNLFAAGLIFPSLKKIIPPKLPLPLVITTATAYAAASLISIGLGATSQLDLAWTGLPLLILATQIPEKISFPILPRSIIRHSLTAYVASLFIYVALDNFS